MKLILALAVFTLVASPFSVGMMDEKSAKDAKVEQQLVDLEKQRSEAVVKGDTDTLEKMTAEDYLFTNPSGQLRTKAQILQDLKSGEMKFESIETDDVKARVYGNAAVVTGRSTTKGKSGGQDVSGQFRFTRVYVKRDGRWQSVSFQQTRIAEPGQ